MIQLSDLLYLADFIIDNLTPNAFSPCIQMQSLNELLDQLQISIQISTTETGSLALVSLSPCGGLGVKYFLVVLGGGGSVMSLCVRE